MVEFGHYFFHAVWFFLGFGAGMFFVVIVNGRVARKTGHCPCSCDCC